MANEIEIVAKVKDASGPGVTSTKKKIEEIGKTADGVSEKTASSAQKIGAGFEKAAVPATAALAAIGLGAKNAIDDASDLNETINKSNTIFGENAGEIEKWANGAAKNLGLSKQEALETAASFGDMFRQLGFSGSEAANMSKTVGQLSADLGSFNNLPTAEVADMLSGAFRGEYDSLQRLVPNINAARVETEALSMTGKKSAKDLTAQEKAAATLAIVQKDSARAAGDFAKTASGAANSSKIQAAEAKNLSANLGSALLPAYTSILQIGLGFTEMLAEHGTATKVLIGVVAGLAAIVLAVNVGMKIATATTVAWSAAQKVATAAQWLWNAAMAANPIGLVIVAVAALVAAIIIAYKHSETFRAIVQAAARGATAAFGWVVEKVKQVIAFIRRNWPMLLAIITGPIGLAVGWVVRNWSRITAGASSVVSGVRRTFSGIYHAIVDPIADAVDWGRQKLQDLLNFAGTIRDRIGSAVSNLIPGFAHGGVVGAAATGGPRGNLVEVGEHGRELVRLPYGSQVIPNGKTEAMLSGGGGGGRTVLEIRSSGSRLDDLILEVLRKAIRVRGGNVQLVLGRS